MNLERTTESAGAESSAGETRPRDAAAAPGLIERLDAIVWAGEAASGRYTFVNRRAEELLGYPAGDWLAAPGFWAERLHPEDRAWAVGHRARNVRAGADHEGEYRLVAADGRARWFHEWVRVARDGAGRPGALNGVMVDVSRRKKAERRMMIVRRELSAEVSDLKCLLDMTGRLDPSLGAGPLLDEVLVSAAALVGADAGALYLPDGGRGDWAVGASVRTTASFAGWVLDTPVGLALRVRMRAADEPVVIDDVLAVPGMRPDHPVARPGSGFRAALGVDLRTEAGEPVGWLAMFFPDPHRPSARTLGLVGRYAVRAAAFLEHALAREAARGVKAAATVPAPRSTAAIAMATPAVVRPQGLYRFGPPRQAPRRVLLVEDRGGGARETVRLLRAAGLEVILADDGPSAIETARAYRPEVVLLDLGLPGMNGLEFADRLRVEVDPDPVRIVALDDPGDRPRTQADGFDDLLVKPVDVGALLARLGQGV